MPAEPQPRDHAAITTAAAAWLARRDRGFNPGEQDAFLQWCREEPRHRAELARLDRTWGALNSLAEWRPAHSTRPNPDLLARGRPSGLRHRWYLAGTLALAASLALGVFLTRPRSAQTLPVPTGLRVIPAPERLVLEDGSIVAPNQGGSFEVAFSPTERRVRVTGGEAHFTVAKNPLRPFVVEVAGVAVRAVGTAFNVRQNARIIDILVTEGQVQIEPRAAPAPTAVVAGERATVDASQPASLPVIVTLTPAQIDHALAWQGVRLDFDALPLAAVVAQFNMRNWQQLTIADPRIADLRVAGSFRADNVEAFTRLLEASFGITVERRPDGYRLLRRPE
jgi:transmembrane sensor